MSTPILGVSSMPKRSLVYSAGITTVNLWEFDYVCLYNRAVPERFLERRSVAKT